MVWQTFLKHIWLFWFGKLKNNKTTQRNKVYSAIRLDYKASYYPIHYQYFSKSNLSQNRNPLSIPWIFTNNFVPTKFDISDKNMSLQAKHINRDVMFLQGLGSLPKWPVSAHSEHVFFNLVSRKSDPETVTLLLYIRNSPRLHRSDLFLVLHIRSSSAGNTPFPFLPRPQIPSPLFLSPR